MPDNEPAPAVVATDAFRLDLAGRRARANGDDVHLTPTEWAMVEYLVRHPERLVTRRQLITAVWGPNYEPDANLLRVHLTHIRRKLEPTLAPLLRDRSGHGLSLRTVVKPV